VPGRWDTALRTLRTYRSILLPLFATAPHCVLPTHKTPFWNFSISGSTWFVLDTLPHPPPCTQACCLPMVHVSGHFIPVLFRILRFHCHTYTRFSPLLLPALRLPGLRVPHAQSLAVDVRSLPRLPFTHFAPDHHALTAFLYATASHTVSFVHSHWTAGSHCTRAILFVCTFRFYRHFQVFYTRCHTWTPFLTRGSHSRLRSLHGLSTCSLPRYAGSASRGSTCTPPAYAVAVANTGFHHDLARFIFVPAWFTSRFTLDSSPRFLFWTHRFLDTPLCTSSFT